MKHHNDKNVACCFTGVIYAHQLKATIGQCIRDLEVLAQVGEPEGFANRVEYLPLH